MKKFSLNAQFSRPTLGAASVSRTIFTCKNHDHDKCTLVTWCKRCPHLAKKKNYIKNYILVRTKFLGSPSRVKQRWAEEHAASLREVQNTQRPHRQEHGMAVAKTSFQDQRTGGGVMMKPELCSQPPHGGNLSRRVFPSICWRTFTSQRSPWLQVLFWACWCVFADVLPSLRRSTCRLMPLPTHRPFLSMHTCVLASSVATQVLFRFWALKYAPNGAE